MAEWRTVTRKSENSTHLFQVIGHPFSFISTCAAGAPLLSVRCFPGHTDEEADRIRYELFMNPEKDPPPCYDLLLKKADEAEEIFEEGWYLSGIGHHLEWCGVNLELAVDEAQELIMWDGRDRLAEDLPPVVADECGFISHKLPYSEFGVGDDDPLLQLYGGRRISYGKKDPAA